MWLDYLQIEKILCRKFRGQKNVFFTAKRAKNQIFLPLSSKNENVLISAVFHMNNGLFMV